MPVLSKRQVELKLGVNAKHLRHLVSLGVLDYHSSSTDRRKFFDSSELDKLKENVHYVVCLECSSYCGQIGTKHLKSCSGLTLAQYVEKHNNPPTLCDVVSTNKAKTEEQKQRQSETLKARFQTLAGEVTRQQISKASKTMMDNGYREVVTKRLTKMNQSKERRQSLRERALNDWANGGPLSTGVKKWSKTEEAVKSITKARTYLTDTSMVKARQALSKTSNLHLRFKDRMVRSGLEGFQTEYECGPYFLDEANPMLKICVEIDGCYWHGCVDCGFNGQPNNLRVDKAKNTYLTNKGWTIVRVRECDIKSDVNKCLTKIKEFVC